MNRVRQLLTSLNCDGAAGVALLLACALLLLPELGGDSARLLLRYDRVALGAGQWWRLLTAHVVHLDFEHALLNSLGLILMWALFARDFRPRQWLLILAGAIAAIDAGLWLRDSTVLWYVGSSGALHGVMSAGTLAHVRRRDLDAWLLAPFLLLKLTYEQLSGALPLVSAPAAVVVDAHLYGALGGLAVALLLRPRREPL
ncbi:MAG: rhombosortase [Sinobacteraceae bacterium]|nr:rhombosortase [Nevskiaceae bacterium]MBV8854267.1 rhombosortase [Nevskiaceae bacterium]